MSDRGRQIIRQWRILQVVERAARGLTVREIHARTAEDASERTVRRDLAQLAESGFPIYDDGERWRHLEPNEGGWTIPVKPTELMLIALSEDLLAPLKGTWLADPLRDLERKLLAVMTPKGRAFFEKLRATSIASIAAPGDLSRHREILDEVHRAVNGRRVLRIDYRKPGAEPETRDVEPYTVWFHDGTVRLITHCRKAGDIRQFVVQRMLGAEALDETFEARSDFDAAKYIRESFGVFHDAIQDVVVDFAPQVAHLVAERRHHHSQRVEAGPGGWSRLTMRASGLPELAAWVAGFGPDAVPRAPDDLVERVRRLHAEGLEALERRG